MNEPPSGRPEAFMDTLAWEVQSSLEPVAQISVDQVFSAPVQSGDVVVIAAAAVSKGGGFGFGGGSDQRTVSVGGGGGGGGGGEGRPVAIIEITPEGTRVKPVIDFTKVGLTLLTAFLGIWNASRRARRG